jgi:integrase
MIKNRKQKNARKETKFPYRFQILENIPDRLIGVFCAASYLRFGNLTDEEKRSINIIMNSKFKMLCEDIHSLKGHNLTLYSLRHSFTTRMRKYYKRSEIAALLGHTGKNSTANYGKRIKSGGYGKTRQVGAWAPKFDPYSADMIMAGWQNPSLDTSAIELTKAKLKVSEKQGY